VEYRVIPPCAAARRFVRTYWMLEDRAPAAQVQRVVPDGRAELIFNLAEPYETQVSGAQSDGPWVKQPQAFLFGQIAGPLLLRPAGPVRMIGISFHPHTAGKLLRVAMPELNGRSFALDDLAPQLRRRLEELPEAPTDADRGAALDRIVLALAARAGECDALLEAAVRELSGASTVAGFAHRVGISPRQLERRFRAAVGISPKLFARMQRFQRVFPTLESGDSGWAETAFQCGYYDQAHLIREFREFAGKPPAALLAVDADLARHFLAEKRMSHLSNTGAAHSR
jgi:AraC-like DNA-binding protein